MSRIISILVFVLLNGIYSQCPAPYTLCAGACTYKPSATATYCDAWQSCEAIQGRLAISSEINVVNSCRSGSFYIWIGMSDLLNEMQLKKNGWLWIDGSVTSNPALWLSTEPDIVQQDCGVSLPNGLGNTICRGHGNYICFYNNTAVSQQRYFTKTATIYNNDSELGCQDVYVLRSVIECGIKCKSTSYCKSFYYEDAKKHCVITKYVDSSLPHSYNNGTYNWQRYN